MVNVRTELVSTEEDEMMKAKIIVLINKYKQKP